MYVIYEQCCLYSGDANGARHNCYLRTSSLLSICSSLEINLYSSHLFIMFLVYLTMFEVNTHVLVMLKILLADISIHF